MGVSKKPPPAVSGPNGLSPKMESAAVALASGATLDEAAKASGAGVTTIKEWTYTLPAFRARINQLRADLSTRVLGRVALGMCTAIDVLVRLSMKGKTEATQLKAAEALLTHGTALSEVADLKAEIAAVKEQLAHQKEPRR